MFANKQDLMNAVEVQDIQNALGLACIQDRGWTIQACSAKTGEGLQEGMEWLVGVVEKNKALPPQNFGQ